MKYAAWPRQAANPPDAWEGLEASNRLDGRGRAIVRIARVLLSQRPRALWLSGSAARDRLTKRSDIDWVLVTDGHATSTDLPVRHSVQVFRPAEFLSRLQAGSEFIVWQLAYGRLLALDDAMSAMVKSTVVPGCSVAAI